MKQYHVSHEGNDIGPLSAEEIVQKVKAHELSPMDFVYDEEVEDWVAIAQYSELASLLEQKKPKPKAPPKSVKKLQTTAEIAEAAPPVAAAEPSKEESVSAVDTPSETSLEASPEMQQALQVEWYILKGENKFGPFAYTDVLKMLQKKIVFEFDFAWHPGLATWKRVAELSAFSAEAISSIKSTLMPEIDDVFFRRKHKRVEFNGSVLVHNNSKVWKGQGVEISAGGVGLVIENSALIPGDYVIIHFKPAGEFPAFNASCEVVSKRFVEGLRDKSAPVRYGLKFTGINKQMQEMLQNFSQHALAAA